MSGPMSPHLSEAVIRGFDDLSSVDRGASLGHVVDCAACRQALLVDDPTRGFALLSTSPIPLDRLDELGRSLNRGLDRMESRSSEGHTGWRGWGAVAAGLVLAGMLSVYLGSNRGPMDPTGGMLPSGFSTRALFELPGVATEPMEDFELLSSPGAAQVLDLSVGETQVVMIFDEDLKI